MVEFACLIPHWQYLSIMVPFSHTSLGTAVPPLAPPSATSFHSYSVSFVATSVQIGESLRGFTF